MAFLDSVCGLVDQGSGSNRRALHREVPSPGGAWLAPFVVCADPNDPTPCTKGLVWATTLSGRGVVGQKR